MKSILRNLLPANAVNAAIYSVVPRRVIDYVHTFDVQVYPTRADWNEAQLDGSRYGLSGTLGLWEDDKRKVTIYLGYLWDYAVGQASSATTWRFAAWNCLLSVIYHEFGHADSWAVGMFDDKATESIGGYLSLQSGYKQHMKREQYAETMSQELHVEADRLCLTTCPGNLGIFDVFINKRLDSWFGYWRKNGNGLGGNWGTFFEQVRMMKFGFDHSKRYVRSLQHVTGSKVEPKGHPVWDRAGRKHWYYTHEDVNKVFGDKSLLYCDRHPFSNLIPTKVHRIESLDSIYASWFANQLMAFGRWMKSNGTKVLETKVRTYITDTLHLSVNQFLPWLVESKGPDGKIYYTLRRPVILSKPPQIQSEPDAVPSEWFQ